MSGLPFGQGKETSSISYQPINHPSPVADGQQYHQVPMADTSYASPALSSPGMSSLNSPGGFKSLEQVKSYNDMKTSDDVRSFPPEIHHPSSKSPQLT